MKDNDMIEINILMKRKGFLYLKKTNLPVIRLVLAFLFVFFLYSCKSNSVKRDIVGNLTKEVLLSNSSFDTYTVNTKKSELAFFFKTTGGDRFGSLGKLKKYLEKNSKELIFATNGGIYNANFDPLGLFVENGREVFPLNMKDGKGNFFMAPNGIFLITREQEAYIIKREDYSKFKDKVFLAIQSGPMLLIDGTINSNFTRVSDSKFIRSGVGIINSSEIIFAISNEPVNFYIFALLFKDKLKCQNALFLDGAISKMYLPASKRYQLDGDFGVIIGIIN